LERITHTYRSFAELPMNDVITISDQMTRYDIIEWLMWNDPNGIYEDELSLDEIGNIVSKEEGVGIMRRQTQDGRLTLI
jgi:hypothetical protein